MTRTLTCSCPRIIDQDQARGQFAQLGVVPFPPNDRITVCSILRWTLNADQREGHLVAEQPQCTQTDDSGFLEPDRVSVASLATSALIDAEFTEIAVLVVSHRGACLSSVTPRRPEDHMAFALPQLSPVIQSGLGQASVPLSKPIECQWQPFEQVRPLLWVSP
jgi:hypothetical protein